MQKIFWKHILVQILISLVINAANVKVLVTLLVLERMIQEQNYLKRCFCISVPETQKETRCLSLSGNTKFSLFVCLFVFLNVLVNN